MTSKVKKARDLGLKQSTDLASVEKSYKEGIKALGPLVFQTADKGVLAKVDLSDNAGSILLMPSRLTEAEARALATWILSVVED